MVSAADTDDNGHDTVVWENGYCAYCIAVVWVAVAVWVAAVVWEVGSVHSAVVDAVLDYYLVVRAAGSVHSAAADAVLDSARSVQAVAAYPD